MNEVINSQGYARAAFWKRLSHALCWLMAVIALCSNVLFSLRLRNSPAAGKLSPVLPFVVLLTADIDAPRQGLIHVNAQNLENLEESLGH